MPRANRRRGALLLALALSPPQAHADLLAWVESRLAKRHPVAERTVAQAREALRASPDDWLVLDVRTAEEFAVSHLPGAVHVPPDTTTDEFSRRFGDALAGRHALFYCSVGQRSIALAARVSAVVGASGGQGAYNLRGGIFRWQAEHGPLRDAVGPTCAVHPYNRFWGLLMPR